MTINYKQIPVARFSTMEDRQPVMSTLEHVVDEIRGGALRALTTEYRTLLALGDGYADKLRQAKKRLPSFLPSTVVRGGRKKSDIESFTGLVMVDIDHIAPERMGEVTRAIQGDSHTVVEYTTVSGMGKRIIAYVDGEITLANWGAVWRAVNGYYARLTGIAIDDQCKNATRISGLCDAPDIYFNNEAQAFCASLLVSSEKCVVSSGLRRVRSTSRLVSSEERGVRSGLRRKADKPLTADGVARQVRDMVESRGCHYVDGNHNNYIASCLYLMNRIGVAEQDATEWALREFADYDAREHSVAATARSCYQNLSEHGSLKLVCSEKRVVSSDEAAANYSLHTTHSSLKKASAPEVRDFLKGVASFRLNVISGQAEVCWRQGDEWQPIEDRDIASLWMRMSEAGLRCTPQMIRDVVTSDFTPKFDPFADYFNSLPQWDGKDDHIRQLASRIHLVDKSEEEHARLCQCLRRWLVAMVAGIMEPKVINHEILVFLGKQGNYKSTFFSLLLPPQLQRYFYTRLTVMSKDKDDLLTLSQYALIAYEEIDCLSPTALNHLKAEVTMRTVNERQVYRHFKECRPHIASFCATGNNVNFLTDATGNRRWLAFEVESIESPIAVPFDYDGIYSQVWSLYKQGEKYWFDGEEINQINERNEYFSAPSLEEELIALYYCQPGQTLEAKLVSTAEILERINVQMKVPLSSKKIGMVMKRLGYEIHHTRTGNKYRVHERTMQEIESAKRVEIDIVDRAKGRQPQQPDMIF